MNSLHSLFEIQVDKNPDNICIITGNSQYTYLEIEQAANRLAHHLNKHALKPDNIIGILVDNSYDFYIIMLAVLKSGAAYLPIDPECPLQRVEYILENSKMSLLITTKNSFHSDTLAQNNIIQYEKIKSDMGYLPSDRPFKAQTSPDNLCYIIYTSGTTGNPKGVAVPHKAVHNYVNAAIGIYGVTAADRVYQGFRIAFDASLEEIWLAFATGATLVSSDAREVREGATLISFLNLHKVTVVSTVPTFLATLRPEVPSLRVLILGGEVCSEGLISRWHRPGLQIFNTYGPSEAAIVTTYHECYPDRKITIGKPIPNSEVIILDDKLQPVGNGNLGELCIGGFGLAREYINKPQLTTEKFIPHPLDSSKRLYRTGDMALINEDGEIVYCGRIDEQIKFRGFRIELCEIEATLRKHPDILDSAVVVHESSGMQFLVAYLVLKEKVQVNIKELRKSLHASLPSYMVPTIFEIIPILPQLPSGKVNKKVLNFSKMNSFVENENYQPPLSETEKKVAAIWEDVLKISPISIDADFFIDLGGHSLAAAKVATLMRNHPEMDNLSLLDLFENSTIQKLAKKIENIEKEFPKKITPEYHDQPKTLIKKLQYLSCVSLQALVSLVFIALPSWYYFIILLLTVTFFSTNTGLTLTQILFLWGSFILLLEPALIGISVLVKWLLLGKIKPGKHKLWGWYYLRWWVANHVQRMASIDQLVGSPFIILYYRLMGAKIGKNCHLATQQLNSFDLISIGDNSSLGSDVIASGYKVENGWLQIGTIQIGENCFVGANSVLSLNTKIENGGKLGEQSLLPEGAIIRENESMVGSPCQAGVVEFSEITKETLSKTKSGALSACLHVFCNFLLLIILELVYLVAAAPGIFLIINYCYKHANFMSLFWTIPLGAMILISSLICQIIILKKIFGPIKEGQYSIKSFSYLKIWFVERLMALGLKNLEPIYGSIYAAKWFSLLGAKIGKNSEVSTVIFTFPEMLKIGRECFIADSCLLSPARVYKGYLSLSPIHLGNRVFVGNGALIPANAKLRSNCLIACASIPPKVAPENTSWIGTPAVFLPGRQKSEFSEEKTYSPNLKLKIARGIIELIRIVLPPLFLYFILTLDIITFMKLREHFNLLTTTLIFPIFAVIYVLLVVNIIILLKWVLIGEYTKNEAPMWSISVWLSEFITSLYDTIVTPFFLEVLLGTPFASVVLRGFGAKIGKYAFINSPYFSEFDLVTIGDRVCLNRECIIQTHLYEDRVFKMQPITIEKDCSIGDRSIILYTTLMQHHSSLGSLSLLMKGEVLNSYSFWEGNPTKKIYHSQTMESIDGIEIKVAPLQILD